MLIIRGVFIDQRTVSQSIPTRHFAQTLLILLGQIILVHSGIVHIPTLRACQTDRHIVVTDQTLGVELFHRTMALLGSLCSILFLIGSSALTVIRNLAHTRNYKIRWDIYCLYLIGILRDYQI